MKFDTVQQGVIDTILDGSVSSMYLTGEAGSGKSAIIKEIHSLAAGKGRRCLLLATSNSAAKNIHGITIHKAFGLALELNEDANTINETHRIIPNRDKLSDQFAKLGITGRDILIIDEISMGGALLAKVLKILRRWERENGTPSTLMLVGDPNQLPPVKDRKQDWSKLCNTTVTLTKNYRTTNAELLAAINRFRDTGRLTGVETYPNILDVEYDGATVIAHKNETLAAAQKVILGADISRWVKKGVEVAVFGLCSSHNAVIGREEFPYFTNGDIVRVVDHPVPHKKYKNLFLVDVENEGYRDMPIKPTSKYVIGRLPKVILGDYSVYLKHKRVLFHEIIQFRNEMRKKYHPAKTSRELKQCFNNSEAAIWAKGWRNYLALATIPFARHSKFITAHKAQGRSIDNIIVMWDDLGDDKLKYVAISRARRKLVVITEG